MQFSPHRTVEEQAERLPEKLREAYRNSQLDRIEIDGQTLQGYFEYSFLEEKSYHEQPVRMQDGTIQDIDNYTTFLTPRLIIKYNMMGIEDYRKLMKLLKSKNAFMVTCYDIVEDKRVTHEMYFAPPSMPIIYQQYLMALGIKEYSIELIGTNRAPKYNVYFFHNMSSVPIEPYYDYVGDGELIYTSTAVKNMSLRIANPSNIQIPVLNQDKEFQYCFLSEVFNYEYEFNGWNTKSDGSGISYTENHAYFFERDTTLFAQWRQA